MRRREFMGACAGAAFTAAAARSSAAVLPIPAPAAAKAAENNIEENPRYFLTSSAEGLEIVRSVGHAHVKFLYDLFHEQIEEGNLIEKLEKSIDLVGLITSPTAPRAIFPDRRNQLLNHFPQARRAALFPLHRHGV